MKKNTFDFIGRDGKRKKILVRVVWFTDESPISAISNWSCSS